MPPPIQPKTPFGDAVTQVVVLAFDFAGQQIPNLPSMLEKALQEPKLQDAISDTLNTFMLQRAVTKNPTPTLSANDAKDLVTALRKAGQSKVTDSVTNQITSGPEYVALQQAVKNFESAAKTTPMGAWVDRNQGILIVSGVALVVGGAAALLVTKTGGRAVNLAVDRLKGKPIKIFNVGKLKVQGQLLAFQPDKRVLGAGLILSPNWKSLDLSLKIGVTASGNQAKEVDGEVALKSGDMNLSVTAKGIPAQKSYNLGLKMGFTSGPLSQLNLGAAAIMKGDKVTGGSANATWKIPGTNLNLSAQENMAGKPEFKALWTWTIHF